MILNLKYIIDSKIINYKLLIINYISINNEVICKTFNK